MLNRNNGLRSVGWAAVCIGMAAALALPAASAGRRRVELNPGDVLAVKLNQTLSSNRSQVGDSFTSTVIDNGLGGSSWGLPRGTEVRGVVTEARPREGKQPGILNLSFNRIILPGGQSYAVSGAPIALDTKSVVKTRDGSLMATKSSKTSRLAYVGYGAGAGLLVSVLADRKHTLRDVLLGAAGGYLAGALTKQHSNPRDVVLKTGSKIGVRVDRRVSI